MEFAYRVGSSRLPVVSASAKLDGVFWTDHEGKQIPGRRNGEEIRVSGEFEFGEWLDGLY